MGKGWGMKLKDCGLEDEMRWGSEQTTSQGSPCGRGNRQQPDPSTWKGLRKLKWKAFLSYSTILTLLPCIIMLLYDTSQSDVRIQMVSDYLIPI